MDALAAVGLAGNVVQFVQFAGELITETAEIKKNGGPSSLPYLRKLGVNLTIQAGLIKDRLKAGSGEQALAPEDKVSFLRIVMQTSSSSPILEYSFSLTKRKNASRLA